MCFAKLRGEPPPFNAEVRPSAHFAVDERATLPRPGDRYRDAGAMLDALQPRWRRLDRAIAVLVAGVICAR